MGKAAFATLLAVGASSVASAETTTIRAGVAVNFEGMLPVMAAKEKGYLADEGIEIETLDFQGGGPTVQAFAGDSVDICFCAGDHVVRLRNRGIPAVFLYGLDDRHDYTLIGKKGAAGSSIAEMKGETLGITSPGSMTDNTLRWAIKELDMKPDSDYSLIPSGTGASMVAAIEGGKVNAGMLVTTDREFLLKRGDFEIVEDFTQLPYAGFSAIVKESWIKENPELAAGLVSALDKASADLRSDPAFAQKLVKELYPTLSDDIIAATAESAVSRIPEGGKYSQDAIDTVNSIMTSADPSLKPITLEESYLEM
ncbi:ABC transporter substrate-binding protein [Afifella sp. IM 167]|uniref:ABC transporter substrate-binding protein n=1 Tax=Afifella sp. IM 167 TaxID=2033586 RepID=UPI001CCC084F|nr:ABC transporter substrate-binding protein [Afifella sp. IM 167]